MTLTTVTKLGRYEIRSKLGAGGAQEAPGRQLESLPRDGGHVTMSCRTGGANWHATEQGDEADEARGGTRTAS